MSTNDLTDELELAMPVGHNMNNLEVSKLNEAKIKAFGDYEKNKKTYQMKDEVAKFDRHGKRIGKLERAKTKLQRQGQKLYSVGSNMKR